MLDILSSVPAWPFAAASAVVAVLAYKRAGKSVGIAQQAAGTAEDSLDTARKSLEHSYVAFHSAGPIPRVETALAPHPGNPPQVPWELPNGAYRRVIPSEVTRHIFFREQARGLKVAVSNEGRGDTNIFQLLVYIRHVDSRFEVHYEGVDRAWVSGRTGPPPQPLKGGDRLDWVVSLDDISERYMDACWKKSEKPGNLECAIVAELGDGKKLFDGLWWSLDCFCGHLVLLATPKHQASRGGNKHPETTWVESWRSSYAYQPDTSQAPKNFGDS